MRSPKIILENLQKHSKEENYKYERLYRNCLLYTSLSSLSMVNQFPILNIPF